MLRRGVTVRTRCAFRFVGTQIQGIVNDVTLDCFSLLTLAESAVDLKLTYRVRPPPVVSEHSVTLNWARGSRGGTDDNFTVFARAAVSSCSAGDCTLPNHVPCMYRSRSVASTLRRPHTALARFGELSGSSNDGCPSSAWKLNDRFSQNSDRAMVHALQISRPAQRLLFLHASCKWPTFVELRGLPLIQLERMRASPASVLQASHRHRSNPPRYGGLKGAIAPTSPSRKPPCLKGTAKLHRDTLELGTIAVQPLRKMSSHLY